MSLWDQTYPVMVPVYYDKGFSCEAGPATSDSARHGLKTMSLKILDDTGSGLLSRYMGLFFYGVQRGHDDSQGLWPS